MLLLALVVAATGLACDRAVPLEEVPPALLGTWKTEKGRHENRTLEVRHREIALAVGGVVFDNLAIQSVDERRTKSGDPVYRLHYQADEGYPDYFEVVLHPGDAGETPFLTVGNIPSKWHRTPSS